MLLRLLTLKNGTFLLITMFFFIPLIGCEDCNCESDISFLSSMKYYSIKKYGVLKMEAYSDSTGCIIDLTLRYLNLDKLNSVKGIFNGISKLKKIRSISIVACSIKDIAWLSSIESIETLSIESTSFKEKITFDNVSKNLKVLCVMGNVNEIRFANDTYIEYLYIINNNGSNVYLNETLRNNKFLKKIIISSDNLLTMNLDNIPPSVELVIDNGSRISPEQKEAIKKIYKNKNIKY